MQIGTHAYPGAYAYPGLFSVVPTGIAAAYDERFYVGPLGRLTALPNVAGQTDTNIAVIGGTHVSLTGAYTRDVFGYKQSWTWTYPMLTARQAKFVEALQRGLVPGPLYLLDPRRPNRLPMQAASGGSLLRNASGFIPSNTASCSWDAMSTITTGDASTLPAPLLLRGALNVLPLAPGALTLELAGQASDGRLDVPAVPGETLIASGCVLGPSSSPTALSVTTYDAGGAAVTTFNADAITPSQTSWSRLAVTVTVPDTAVSLRVVLSQNAASNNSSWFTALQVALPQVDPVGLAVSHDADDTDLGGGWHLGGGAPQVVPDVGASSYPYPGVYASALTLTEK